MDINAIIALLKTAGAALSGPAAAQLVQWATTFVSALPGIEAGVLSAEPFLQAAMNLILNGGQPVAKAQWDAQMSLLTAQIATVDAQVQKDAEDQP